MFVVVVVVVVVYLSIYLSICLSVCLSTYLSIYLSISLSLHVQAGKRSYSSSFFELDNIKNAAILRTSSIFEVGNIENEAILRGFLQFSKLTTSKTKEFCETSSIFEVDSIKNEAILRDFLQKWKVECRAGGLLSMHFAFCPLHLSKVLRLPRKRDARSYEVLHLSCKIILANLKISGSKMQPLSGNALIS